MFSTAIYLQGLVIVAVAAFFPGPRKRGADHERAG